MSTDARVLLSIHLTSNRPKDFVTFLDKLEETTDDPHHVEVVVKIDETDKEMNEILPREKPRRPFNITYISTPLEGGFFGLWKWYDPLLKLTDPSAYFVVSLNDEMYFVEKGWDTRLKKYVDLYPDGIYRLRLSRHRERNTFDYWEACYAGDLTPFMTKKWLDLSGGWCPCNGPDSFQNSVAYYFGWLYRHDTFNRPYRERAVHDLEFTSQGSMIGMTDPGELLKRTQGSTVAWDILISYPIQQEAARRAQILHAHIWAAEKVKGDYEVNDDSKRKILSVIEPSSGNKLWSASYKISRARIVCTNFFRNFWWPYYMGMGEAYRATSPERMRYYFLARHGRRLKRLPDLNFSPARNFLKDSLLYRYTVAFSQVILALLRR